MAQKKSSAVAEPQGAQIDSQRVPRFPWIVVHRDPRTRALSIVATFAYKSHAAALIRQLAVTNPDAPDRFEVRPNDY